MRVFERITIKGSENSFKLPVPAEAILQLLDGIGLKFEYDGFKFSYRNEFEPNRLNQIKELLAANQMSLVVTRSMLADLDDNDFRSADLLVARGIPDIWITKLNFESKCRECGKCQLDLDLSFRVDRVSSNKKFCAVNGQFIIVRDDLAEAIIENTSGAELHPFDKENRYWYLCARSRLRCLILTPENSIGAGDNCTTCGKQKYEVIFGPLCYRLSEWNGDDIVWCDHYSEVVFSPKALTVVSKFQKSIARGGIIQFK